jgi:hypothetical protein
MKIYYPSHPCLYTNPCHGINVQLFGEEPLSSISDDVETFDITFDELIQLLQEERRDDE